MHVTADTAQTACTRSGQGTLSNGMPALGLCPQFDGRDSRLYICELGSSNDWSGPDLEVMKGQDL